MDGIKIPVEVQFAVFGQLRPFLLPAAVRQGRVQASGDQCQIAEGMNHLVALLGKFQFGLWVSLVLLRDGPIQFPFHWHHVFNGQIPRQLQIFAFPVRLGLIVRLQHRANLVLGQHLIDWPVQNALLKLLIRREAHTVAITGLENGFQRIGR